MKKIFNLFLFSLFLNCTAFAQARCDVFVWDVYRVRALAKLLDKSENPETAKALKKAITAAMKTVGKFKPELCEECLTTKTYKFPQSNLKISASTYSTDESMQSTNIDASIMFGIVVATKPKPDAIHALNNSSVEITFDDNTDVVELRKNLIVKRRKYVVGMTCHFKEKDEKEK